MKIKQGTNKFYIGDKEDEPLAQMTYVNSNEEMIIIDSAYVSEELRNQGAAKLLLKELIEWARKENKKIIPLCPFAKNVMNDNEEYHDMIHQ